jgi:prepilin peptidase CpaA
MSILQYAVFGVFPLIMAYAGVSDLLTLTIPNRASMAAIVGFAIAAALVGMDLATVGLHIAGGAAVLAGGFVFFSFRWIGGGDAKIAAVAALWLGLDRVLEFLVLGALFGGALTIIVLLARRRLLPAIAVRQQWLLRLHDPASGVPYALALAAAALVIYPKTPWIGLLVG